MNKDYVAIIGYVKSLNPPKKDPCWVSLSQLSEAVSIRKERVSELLKVCVEYKLLRVKGNLISMHESWYGNGISKRARDKWLPYEKDTKRP